MPGDERRAMRHINVSDDRSSSASSSSSSSTSSSSGDTDVSDEDVPGRAMQATPKKKKGKKSQPGRYSQLVIDTIRRLGERNGSSLARVFSEAKKVPWFDQQNGRTYLRYSLRALVQNGTLLQVKGIGANGSFRLNRRKEPEGGQATPSAAAARPAAASAAGAKKSHKKKPPTAGGEPKKSHKKQPGGGDPAAKRSHKKKKPSGPETASPLKAPQKA